MEKEEEEEGDNFQDLGSVAVQGGEGIKDDFG